MKYIKILIILVLLGLIYYKNNNIEKMTDTKIIKESLKNHIIENLSFKRLEN